MDSVGTLECCTCRLTHRCHSLQQSQPTFGPDWSLHQSRSVPCAGPTAGPLLVLSNSLGTDMTMWDAQMPAFLRSCRVLRYDTRGHGKSSVPPGPYSIQQLAKDVIRLLDFLNEGNAYFCGFSMGGEFGMWRGLHHSDRFRRRAFRITS